MIQNCSWSIIQMFFWNTFLFFSKSSLFIFFTISHFCESCLIFYTQIPPDLNILFLALPPHHIHICAYICMQSFTCEMQNSWGKIDWQMQKFPGERRWQTSTPYYPLYPDTNLHTHTHTRTQSEMWPTAEWTVDSGAEYAQRKDSNPCQRIENHSKQNN